MFTIDIQAEPDCGGSFVVIVKLKFSTEDIKVVVSPENADAIRTMDVETMTGFDTSPSNGIFSLYWEGKTINFHIGKYGDGNGGDMHIAIPKTEENMKSLRNCLRIWKDFVIRISE